MATLADYAKRNGSGCVICDLDPAIRKQIEEGVILKVTYRTCREWLKDEFSIEITRHQIGRHFVERHHIQVQGWD